MWNPRRAGKRMHHSFYIPCRWYHPRTGGEKLFRLPLFQSPLGSPPRRRGKAGLFQIVNVGLGITPAQAGKRLESVLDGSAE